MTIYRTIRSLAAIPLLAVFSATVAADDNRAVALMSPTEGSDVTGSVVFEQTDEGVRVTADLTGLSEGDHGFHVHQWGDCSSGDGKSAGGHFNPEDVDHAGPEADSQHVGDMGNVTANSDGAGFYEAVLPFLALAGDHSIIGRGVIVHAGKDDLMSQPTGDAGDRVACGVIGWQEG